MNKIRAAALLFSIGSIFASAQQLPETPACPCCTENHRAFDFWIGQWEVELATGQPAGTNRIVRSQNGCVLQEFWSSASQGFTGTSLNFYNAAVGQWEQLWVDSSGNVLKLSGNRQGDQMILSSEPFLNAQGVSSVNRITWTLNKDGSVRQLWELLQDRKSVQVVFDGLYRKKE
ncbi:hypothetical protein [Robiginitalea sp. IMCC43444]|uniref:hypothetical protein n=1 Tax=Robiginitalea sp. IMCC43444 TaxID=3459121 RepID=UPI004040F78B